MNASSITPRLDARGFTKRFGGRIVLENVSIQIAPGEVHGLVGQNGSGKSTLIKVLSGFHAPEDGAELSVCGERVALPLAPDRPAALGMFFVHQDLALAEDMTVLENVSLGRYRTARGWRIKWRSERRRVRALLDEFHVNAKPDSLVGELRDVDRAMIAILRALEPLASKDAGVLVLDEATAYLPRDGVDILFAAVREIARKGIGVLFVSHRLDEVRAVTDRVSILRDGKLVTTADTASLSERDLITGILGRPLEQLYPASRDESTADVALSVRGLSGARIRDFDLDVRAGEVVGLTGLLGMGAEDVLYLLFGATKGSGTVRLGGSQHRVEKLSPRVAIREKVILLPGNRNRDSGTRAASVRENVTLPTVQRFVRRGLLRTGVEERTVSALLEEFQVQPPSPNALLGTLSGGNQQKALLAKWFSAQPNVLLLHEPTQGVDIGAKSQIFRLIKNAAAQKRAVLIASTEYEDLAHICDRVVVIRDGRAVADLSGAALTRERLIEQSFIAERDPSAPVADVLAHLQHARRSGGGSDAA